VLLISFASAVNEDKPS